MRSEGRVGMVLVVALRERLWAFWVRLEMIPGCRHDDVMGDAAIIGQYAGV